MLAWTSAAQDASPCASNSSWLRQRASPGEAAIALQALVRRGELDPSARLSVFSELAAHFRAMVEFPAADTEGISDEQYVRNVVDILYKNG